MKVGAFGIVLLGVLLAATPAWAARVVVLDANDFAGRGTGEKNRDEIVRALEEKSELELVSISEWRKAAKRKNVAARDWDRPKGIARVAPAARVDAIVTLQLRGGVGNAKLEAIVFDGRGQELWSREIPFKGRVLPEKLARKLAAAVTAAAVGAKGVGPDEGGDDVPIEVEPVAPRRADRDRDRDRDRDGDRDSDRGGDRDRDRDRGGDRDRDRGGDRDRGVDSDRDRDRGGDSGRSDGREGDEGSEAAADEAVRLDGGPDEDFNVPKKKAGAPRFPMLEADAGLVLTWRSYEFKAVDGSTPVTYTTQTPYPGFQLRVATRPLRGLTMKPLQGLGLEGELSYGRLSSKFTDDAGVVQSFESQETHWSADLLYGFAFGDAPDSIVASARVGFDSHAFEVGENPATVSSVRSSPRAGAEVNVPIVAPHLGVSAMFVWLFAPDPGDAERAAYGPDAKGSGFRLQVGAGNRLAKPTGLIYDLHFHYASYSDNYAGGPFGGGKAAESYYGVGVTAGWAL